MKPANTNESQSRLRAHGGFGPHYFFFAFFYKGQNLWTKFMDKKNKYKRKKEVQKKKKKGQKKRKKGQKKKGQNKKYYILHSPPRNNGGHTCMDINTTDERPFSDEAEKTLQRGITMMVEDLVFRVRDDLDAQSIRQELTLDIEKVQHQVDDLNGDIIQNTDAIDNNNNAISDIENDISSIQQDVSMLIDNEVSQNDLDDIRRELDVFKAAIANMLSGMADNAANVSTEYLWALKNTDR